MANHPSALKRMRQTKKKRLRNKSYKSKVRTVVKKYLTSVENKESIGPEELRQAVSLLHKGVCKGIYHRNTASRTIARLSRRLTAA
ncbi:MAG: 30S ribosomal protein S20 [Deltaproteobacteria bacterium]|nr:30S ribosomal protein S20 [Deltaproteobacteria bacterium]